MLKTVFKSIRKNKIVSLFLIIQFTLAISTSLMCIEEYRIVNSKKNMVSKVFDIEKTLVVYDNTIIDDTMNHKKFGEGYSKTLDELKSINGIRNVGYFLTEKNSFGAFEGKISNLGIKQCIYVNKEMMDIVDIRTEHGERITGDMLYKDLGDGGDLPVAVGATLNEKNKCFDIYYNFKRVNCKGIYTIKANTLFPDSNQYITIAPTNLNKAVVMKMYDDTIKMNAIWIAYIKYDAKDVNELKDNIYKKFKNQGIEVRVVTMKEDIDKYIQEHEQYMINYLKITIGLSIFSVFGTVATLILSVNRRKKEFGIRMATGSSKIYLLRLVFGEIVVINIAAYIFALILVRTKTDDILSHQLGITVMELFNFTFSIKYILIMLCILLAFSSVIVKMILNLKPSELVRGKN